MNQVKLAISKLLVISKEESILKIKMKNKFIKL